MELRGDFLADFRAFFFHAVERKLVFRGVELHKIWGFELFFHGAVANACDNLVRRVFVSLFFHELFHDRVHERARFKGTKHTFFARFQPYAVAQKLFVRTGEIRFQLACRKHAPIERRVDFHAFLRVGRFNKFFDVRFFFVGQQRKETAGVDFRFCGFCKQKFVFAVFVSCRVKGVLFQLLILGQRAFFVGANGRKRTAADGEVIRHRRDKRRRAPFRSLEIYGIRHDDFFGLCQKGYEFKSVVFHALFLRRV